MSGESRRERAAGDAEAWQSGPGVLGSAPEAEKTATHPSQPSTSFRQCLRAPRQLASHSPGPNTLVSSLPFKG